MTVQEMVDFLSNYCGEYKVTMLQCADDNPMTDDVGIREVVAFERSGENETIIVIIPD